VGLLGGVLVEYVFILELDFLEGRKKLGAPVYALLGVQEEAVGKEEEEAEEGGVENK